MSSVTGRATSVTNMFAFVYLENGALYSWTALCTHFEFSDMNMDEVWNKVCEILNLTANKFVPMGYHKTETPKVDE